MKKSSNARDMGVGLRGLLDTRFSNLVSLRWLRMLYSLGLVANILTGCFVFWLAIESANPVALLFIVAIGTVVVLVQIITLRITLELVILAFCASGNLRKLVELRGGIPAELELND